MKLELPNIVIEIIIKALDNGILIQKQARLCDLAALDFIPVEILPYLKLHHQKAIAKSPVTSQRIFKDLSHLLPKNYRKFNNSNHPEHLRKLAQSEDWRERTRVGENTSTPVDVLEALADDPFDNDGTGSAFVRQAVAGNPASPIKILEKLAQDWSKSVRSSVASNPSTPVYLLENLATYKYGSPVFYALVRNPLIPSYLLAKIAKLSDSMMVLELVAKHYNTPKKILKYLSKKDDIKWSYRLKIPIAENSNTPPEVLAELATDPYYKIWFDYDRKGYAQFLIQIAVASNFNTPLDVLEFLYKERDIFVCIALAKNQSTPRKILNNLAIKEDYLVQHQKGYRNSIKEIKAFDTLNYYKSYLFRIRLSLAGNFYTPQNILEKLFEDRDSNIQLAIAQNFNTPTHVLETLAKHRNYYVRLNVSKRINNPLFLLEKLFHCKIRYIREEASNRIYLICREISSNPNTSIEQLHEILKHQDVEVRLSIIQHPQGLSLLLDRCLKPERCLPEQNSLNRVLAGMHPAISQQQIDRLFHSENWLDRLSVACNPKIPREYLLQLAQDRNNIIQQVAEELLSEQKD